MGGEVGVAEKGGAGEGEGGGVACITKEYKKGKKFLLAMCSGSRAGSDLVIRMRTAV